MNPSGDPNDRDAEAHAPELAELRAALRALPAPRVDDAAVRRAFRDRRRELDAARAVARRRRARVHAALAAAIAFVAVGGVVRFVVSQSPQRSQAPQSDAPAAVAAFQPLLYAPEVAPGAAYSVVRVRIPLSSLTLLPAAGADGMIEADLLVGEDGLARGIRFDGAGALPVSQASY
ncbi:MAG TPA: hypothetical protein VHH11_16345 [Gammaproteobacteria bacterium]|nr:hypothetical protein [Gammaproteobacteria bacterium]